MMKPRYAVAFELLSIEFRSTWIADCIPRHFCFFEREVNKQPFDFPNPDSRAEKKAEHVGRN